jgi:hypothetical protein
MTLTGLAFATAAKILADFAAARNAPEGVGSESRRSWLGTYSESDDDFFRKPVGLFARFDSRQGQSLGGVLAILERSNGALVEALEFAETALGDALVKNKMDRVTDAKERKLEEEDHKEAERLIGGRALQRAAWPIVQRAASPIVKSIGGRSVQRADKKQFAEYRQPRRASIWESRAPMILGVVAACRGGFLLLCDVEPAPGTESLGAGVSRRLFAADVAFSAACVTALYAGGAMDPSDVVGAVACTAAGWAISAAALFANRDPLGPDPPRGEFLARRALAAAGIVATWGAWVQARHSG